MELIVALVMLPVGLLSLFLGRKLFWLFVGLSGFLLGLLLGGVVGLGNNWEAPVIFLVALSIGVAAAILSIYLQKPMASLAGFVLGGLLAAILYMLVRFGTNIATRLMFGGPGAETWVLFLGGGLVAAIFVWVTYEWALIVLSSLSGALVTFAGISSFMPQFMPGIVYLLILAGLAAIGIYVQAQMLSKTQAVAVVPVAAPPVSATSFPSPPPPAPAAQAPSSDICPQCGAPVRPGAKFCNRCGATVAVGDRQ